MNEIVDLKSNQKKVEITFLKQLVSKKKLNYIIIKYKPSEFWWFFISKFSTLNYVIDLDINLKKHIGSFLSGCPVGKIRRRKTICYRDDIEEIEATIKEGSFTVKSIKPICISMQFKGDPVNAILKEKYHESYWIKQYKLGFLIMFRISFSLSQ